MDRAPPRLAPAHDPRDPPLDPEFGITFVLATANDVRKFVLANTEPKKNDQTREGAR
jgi:hypothetical protein